MVLKTNESFFLAYRNGRLIPEMYEPEELHMNDFYGYPGMQAAWDIRKHLGGNWRLGSESNRRRRLCRPLDAL